MQLRFKSPPQTHDIVCLEFSAPQRLRRVLVSGGWPRYSTPPTAKRLTERDPHRPGDSQCVDARLVPREPPSSRALERTLNHHSTTRIRGDTSTHKTRSPGITVRSLRPRRRPSINTIADAHTRSQVPRLSTRTFKRRTIAPTISSRQDAPRQYDNDMTTENLFES